MFGLALFLAREKSFTVPASACFSLPITNQSRYQLVILNSQKDITSSRVNRCGRLFSAEELMHTMFHPHQSTVSHSASANAYFLTGPADKASSLVPTLMPLNWHTLKCAAVENAARGQLCIYRYLDLYFHLSFIFQNALGITTGEVAAFLGRKHETETRLPLQNWPQAASDACTGLIGITTAAFGTVASIAFDGTIYRELVTRSSTYIAMAIAYSELETILVLRPKDLEETSPSLAKCLIQVMLCQTDLDFCQRANELANSSYTALISMIGTATASTLASARFA
jgi:hypothetical protein